MGRFLRYSKQERIFIDLLHYDAKVKVSSVGNLRYTRQIHIDQRNLSEVPTTECFLMNLSNEILASHLANSDSPAQSPNWFSSRREHASLTRSSFIYCNHIMDTAIH